MPAEMPEVAGVSHRWVEARGLRFHVAEAGEGDDVVLCLHGWPQHWYEWRHLMPALAESGHRVLALDQRGFGWSDAPAGGYEKENLATDVLAVMDALDLERVKLVGHDWGGWIGFLLCLRAPQRFERYLSLNILPPWTSARSMLPHLWRFWYQWLVLSPLLGYRLHRGGQFVPRLLVGASTRREVWDGSTLRAFADNLAEPARAMAGVRMYRTFNLREVGPIMRGRYARQRLRVPTLMLFGTDDAALRPELVDPSPRHADEMRLELVEDCGHFIADERPDLVTEKARKFLA